MKIFYFPFWHLRWFVCGFVLKFLSAHVASHIRLYDLYWPELARIFSMEFSLCSWERVKGEILITKSASCCPKWVLGFKPRTIAMAKFSSNAILFCWTTIRLNFLMIFPYESFTIQCLYTQRNSNLFWKCQQFWMKRVLLRSNSFCKKKKSVCNHWTVVEGHISKDQKSKINGKLAGRLLFERHLCAVAIVSFSTSHVQCNC